MDGFTGSLTNVTAASGGQPADQAPVAVFTVPAVINFA
jgi:hypothetical protein